MLHIILYAIVPIVVVMLAGFISGTLSEIEEAPWDLPHGETSNAQHHPSVAKQGAKQQE